MMHEDTSTEARRAIVGEVRRAVAAIVVGATCILLLLVAADHAVSRADNVGRDFHQRAAALADRLHLTLRGVRVPPGFESAAAKPRGPIAFEAAAERSYGAALAIAGELMALQRQFGDEGNFGRTTERLEQGVKGLEELRERYAGDRGGFARALGMTNTYLEIVALQSRRQHEAALVQVLEDRRRLVADIKIAGALVLAVVVLGTWRYVRRSFAAIKTILELDARRRVELRKSLQHVKELSRRLIETEEVERHRINRELHDRIGQNLSAVGFNLALARSRLPADALGAVVARFDDMTKLVEETTRDVRNIMAELHPPALDHLGLFAALQGHAGAVSERLGLPIRVSGADLSPRPGDLIEIALFRITQEALNNIAKHASAGSVEIELRADPARLSLVIADDGVGFDPARAAMRNSWGMSTMRERAEAIGGRFRVQSAPAQGTRVVIEIDEWVPDGQSPRMFPV